VTALSSHSSVPRPVPASEAALLGRLERLRAELLNLGPDDALLSLLTGLSSAVEQIMVEHSGLAEELLSVYEQLGAVFDITRRLPGVSGEAEVVDLFIDSLSRSFSRHDIFVIHAGHLESGKNGPAPSASSKWLNPLAARSRDESRVLVEPVTDPSVARMTEEVMIGPVFAGDVFVCAIVLSRSPEVPRFRTGDMLLLESLTMFCGDMIRNHRLVRELQNMSLAMVRSLVNAVDQKDTYTSGHSLRVAFYATMIGRALGMKPADLQMLQWSALLHDVGKIGIRDDVLKKEGRLTDDEFAHIKEHPVRSHRVVQEVPQLAAALDGVLHHHERYDGTGYPSGLKGEAIPLQARIIQIADVFDALTSDRSYRAAHTWPRALEILREGAGQAVDPHLQTLFDRLVRVRLQSDPDGWRRMVEEADAFAESMEPRL